MVVAYPRPPYFAGAYRDRPDDTLRGRRDHYAIALVATADCTGCHGPMQPGLLQGSEQLALALIHVRPLGLPSRHVANYKFQIHRS